MTEVRLDAGADSTGIIDSDTRERYVALLKADRRSTYVATALTMTVALFWWIVPFMIISAAGMTWLALRQTGVRWLNRGDMRAAILVFAAGLWGSALVIVFLVPFALPVVVFNLVTPVVIAGSFLNARAHASVAVSASVVSGVLALFAYFQDGYWTPDGYPQWQVAMVMTFFMVEHTTMFTTTVRDANRVTEQHYQKAIDANSELAHSEAELWRSRRRVVDVAERERRRIERDIHDGAQQRLVSAALQLQLAEIDADAGTPVTSDRLETVRSELNEAVNDLRSLASGIYPSILADQGLAKAIHAVARLNPQQVTIDVPDAVDVTDRVKRALYFITMEALQNAAKHAGIDAAVNVRLTLNNGSALLEVIDDGEGFEIDAAVEAGGLANMADRAAAEGGTLRVQSRAGRGTNVTAKLPVAIT